MCNIIGCYHNRVEHASMPQDCCKKAHLMLLPMSTLYLILVLTRMVFGNINRQQCLFLTTFNCLPLQFISCCLPSFTLAVRHKLGQYGGKIIPGIPSHFRCIIHVSHGRENFPVLAVFAIVKPTVSRGWTAK